MWMLDAFHLTKVKEKKKNTNTKKMAAFYHNKNK